MFELTCMAPIGLEALVGLFEKWLCILAHGPIWVRHRRREEIKQCGDFAAALFYPLGGSEPKGKDALRFYVGLKPVKRIF